MTNALPLASRILPPLTVNPAAAWAGCVASAIAPARTARAASVRSRTDLTVVDTSIGVGSAPTMGGTCLPTRFSDVNADVRWARDLFRALDI
jgi:hypothetical protein